MPDLLEAIENGVAWLTLNRPERLNALSGEMTQGLTDALQLPLLMRNCPKPIVAAINGPVAGAGLGLALACDLRVAGKSARFGTAFVRIGYSGDYGGTWSLTRLVGTAKARELYLLGDVIDAETALSLGMVNKLVDDAVLRDETMTLARRLADGPRVALGYIKTVSYTHLR